MTLIDVVVTTLVVGLAWVLTVPRLRGLSSGEGRVVQASFALHVLSSVAIMVVAEVAYRGVVDFAGFRMAGALIADEMRQDFWGVAPRAIKLFFHQYGSIINVPLNLEPKGGKSTVSMWIIAAFGDILFLRSFQATGAACALFSFSGKLAMFQVLRGYFPERLRPAAAAGVLLVPSTVFWTSGLVKEGIAVGGLGYALLGAHRLLIERKPTGLVPLLFGAVMVLMIKPYLLTPFGIGMGAMLYSHRSRGADGLVRIRPVWLLGAGVVALLAILIVGRMFPEFSLDTVGEQAARMQFYGQRAVGGSSYILGDPTQTSLMGQLRFAPIALFTALFRPLIIEAYNAQVLVNSLETTAVLGITVLVLSRRGPRWIVAALTSNPALAFAISFTLPLALGTGLVSNNLGTLSRYRCPMMPCFVLVLLMLYLARDSELTAPIKAAVAPLSRGLARAGRAAGRAVGRPGARTGRRPAPGPPVPARARAGTEPA